MGTSSRSTSKLWKWLLESPPAEWALNQLRELTIGALKQGPIPRHVAFVMDGNRRYARKNRLETVEGHSLGFEALARILEVCYRAGVKCVTIYAFSIENFNRPKFEVDALMDMARIRLYQLAQHGDLLDRYGASIHILGQRDLLRADVLEALEHAEAITAHNKTAMLNVCFPYTSREEITQSIRKTVTQYSTPLNRVQPKRHFSESRISHNIRTRQLSTLPEEARPSSSLAEHPSKSTTNGHGSDRRDRPSTSPTPSHSPSSSSTNPTSVESSPAPPPATSSTTAEPPHNPSKPRRPSVDATSPLPDPAATYLDAETITADTLTANMYTAHSPPLDLLVRTSGVERLSDFMLWQAHENTSIVFLKCLWPEFDLWRFLPVLIEWQWWNIRAGGRRADPPGLGLKYD